MESVLHVVSVSGGKDSTALYCWAIEQFGKTNFKAIFADTGHEHPVTYNYLRHLSEMANGPEIQWVKADFKEGLERKNRPVSGNPFLDMMIWKGRAPSTKAQFCTEFLKMRPIRTWLESVRKDQEVFMYVGIRAGESLKRSKMPEHEYSEFYDCDMIRPLLRWTKQQVFDYLKNKGVPPNPLYEAGFSRVGCFPCIHATKSELAKLPEWAWEKLAEWEKRLGRSWFAAGSIPGVFIPTIEDVKQWAMTTHGGKQFALFQEDSKDVPSCMSTWGHCE